MDLEVHRELAQGHGRPLLPGCEVVGDPVARGHVPARPAPLPPVRPRRPTPLMPNAHRACDDFHSTSESRRRSFLDTPLSRRQVIGRGLGAGLAVYAAKAMPLARILEAASAEAAVAPNAPVVVAVFLPGGCDLLDTIVPVSQYGRYADLPAGVKVEAPLPLGSTGLGVNPQLAGLKSLFEAGKIGLMPGIDYANPDLSHFHSRPFWETGLITPDQATGL